MKRIQHWLLIGLAPLISQAVGSEQLPTTELLSGLELERKSTGSAYYARVIHVYDAALYGPPELTPERLLDGVFPKCLRLDYHVSLEREQIVKAAETILARQHEDLSAWTPAIAQLHTAYRDVRKGDHYSLCYLPTAGMELRLNGETLTQVREPGFASIYFGIWLGENAISPRLREELTRFD